MHQPDVALATSDGHIREFMDWAAPFPWASSIPGNRMLGAADNER